MSVEIIKFIQILPKRGRFTDALFKVNYKEIKNKEIKIGVTERLRCLLGITTEGQAKLFLNQFGPPKIMLMIANNKLSDYRFQASDFQKENGSKIEPIKVLERLENETIEAWKVIEKDIFQKNLRKASYYIQEAENLNEPKLAEECRFICDYIANTILKSSPVYAQKKHKKAREINFKLTEDFKVWFKKRLEFYRNKKKIKK